ncbi:MAG: D-aminoacyl-tRNA deacylase [Pseudomonadota bacterium]|jgi:D-tyrosyl-tRNA(Tyr) deacylase
MRVVAQRVQEASVTVAGQVVGRIGRGLLLLVGVTPEDTAGDITWLVRKLTTLRIFPDADGVMNQPIAAVQGEMLAVSQFTLYASTRKGARPSWSRAAPPELAQPLFDAFVRELSAVLGKPVPTGVFGAHMQVALVNDGPVTLILDSKNPE